ncbi:MAG TPA: YeeE/YedE family protein [Burkholderiales bacterium]|nr:YeeE/YedE family protein [Burkholderiales bacterium]
MNALAAFGAGLVFGIGLIVSGMTDPGKVIGFLDLAGHWDPSLAFVMGGAILVGFFAFRVAAHRTRNFLRGAMHLPQRRDIDNRLVLGSLVFGIGWGLAGYCPGPALVSFASGVEQAAVFVAAMLLGMAIYIAVERRIHAPRRAAREQTHRSNPET